MLNSKRKKNVFIIIRLFSGFEASLKQKKWLPEGVPTIYKLLESLQHNSNLTIFFTSKDSGNTYISNWNEKQDIGIQLRGLQAKIYVLSGIDYFKSFLPKKILMIFRDFRHLLKVIKYIIINKPDLIYLDSSNVVIAAFLKIIFPKSLIVLRVLGVCSFLRTLVQSKRLIHMIYKMAFKANFSAVIATQDGSGIEYWLDKVLRKNVKRHILLNGVDRPTKEEKIDEELINLKNQKKLLVLFIGRMEEYKGINEFIDVACKLLKDYEKKLIFVIVGNGSLFKKSLDSIRRKKLQNSFHFLSNIPHKKVMKLHQITDIYVSTNNDGNLSNANLEAISSNDCMVIPKRRLLEKIDLKTYFYLQNSVIYYDIKNTKDLIIKLKRLINNPSEIKKMETKISKKKNSFLKSWNQRILEEENILFYL